MGKQKIPREFIDINWDKEFSPPAWVVRYVKRLKDGSLLVQDANLPGDKRKAIKLAKEWAKKMKLRFIM